MSIFISKNELTDGLKRLFDNISNTPLLIHSDILKIGIVDKMKSRKDICEDYLSIIKESAGDRPLLFPTFNYDFCRDGVYHRQESPGQVGALSEYVSRAYSARRTRTPVFNFGIFDHGSFTFDETGNPFGPASTFAEIHEQQGVIVFLGAGFETSTFLHYIEESCNIGYRYLKPFRGKIIDNGQETGIELKYRVRPLIEHAAEYDWKRLTEDLRVRKILHSDSLGNGHINYCSSGALFEYWSEKINDDEFFLLNPRSRVLAEELYRKFGRPLTFEKVESP